MLLALLILVMLLLVWWKARAHHSKLSIHQQFDIAFREQETKRQGSYSFQKEASGTCGTVAGPNGTPVRIRMGIVLPHWKAYAEQVDLHGAHAVVVPYPRGAQVVTKKRVAGSPIYKLSCRDKRCWCWVPISGSCAEADVSATGGMHQVAIRAGCAPSDPTIEQFPIGTLMYLVHSEG